MDIYPVMTAICFGLLVEVLTYNSPHDKFFAKSLVRYADSGTLAWVKSAELTLITYASFDPFI
jgi:hypothetical protein